MQQRQPGVLRLLLFTDCAALRALTNIHLQERSKDDDYGGGPHLEATESVTRKPFENFTLATPFGTHSPILLIRTGTRFVLAVGLCTLAQEPEFIILQISWLEPAQASAEEQTDWQSRRVACIAYPDLYTESAFASRKFL